MSYVFVTFTCLCYSLFRHSVLTTNLIVFRSVLGAAVRMLVGMLWRLIEFDFCQVLVCLSWEVSRVQ